MGKKALMYSEPFKEKSYFYVPINKSQKYFRPVMQDRGHRPPTPQEAGALQKSQRLPQGCRSSLCPRDSRLTPQSSCCRPRG